MTKPIYKLTLLLLAAASTALTARADGYLDRSGWKWSASSICEADGSDITGLNGICDGDASTCWHSNWHAAAGSAERSNPHWIMIDRGSDTSEFYALSYLPRQLNANQACTSYYIYLADRDLSTTPSTSVDDIVRTLGTPAVSGTWEGNTEEKIAQLEKPTSARYILFVNVESSASSSAACAELNLIGKNGGSTSGGYNSIRILPKRAGMGTHHIAIQGDALTFSMYQGWLRMSNTDITVEYDLADVQNFQFENYKFAVDESYVGNKEDVLTSTFRLGVLPAQGEVTKLSGIAIVPPSATRFNAEVEDSVVLTFKGAEIASFTAAALDALRQADGSFPLPTGEFTEPGDYKLTVPAAMMIVANGSRSKPLEAQWTVTGQDGISAPETDSALTFARMGGTLTIGGIQGAATVTLYDLNGRAAASARVSANGNAAINVAALPAGVYLLNVNNTTLKITL
ncbi:MAG: discoidin domain-containing protein [Muribaculaceae bacterium]|nr:discoidin domain-containing protein [Muribaculaceae bacterium]